MRTSVRCTVIAAVLFACAGLAAAESKPDRDHAAQMAGIDIDSKLFGHTIFGGGYADFVTGGTQGENAYWVFAQGVGPLAFGRWYADVRIGFVPTPYDFRALYSVDCVEVKRSTREAWIDGTIIDSNNPANIGRRAFLYVKDGGGIGGADFHAITPLAAGVNCRQRPTPDFMEQTRIGNFYVER